MSVWIVEELGDWTKDGIGESINLLIGQKVDRIKRILSERD